MAMAMCDVAIIGAGPYGLSLAAHLRASGVNFRIFGSPMRTWIHHMPQGMHLKSEGFASSLYAPDGAFTLKDYCRERGLPYAAIGSPVPLETFWAYGLEFQKRFVPELEDQWVSALRRTGTGYEVTLKSGETLTARRVVVAVGLTYFDYTPPILASLPPEFVTHSSGHAELDRFRGREVAIVGAGASAVDLAALLYQAGAKVEVVARGAKIRFHDPPDNLNPSWFDRLQEPVTGIGPGWKLFWCANLPLLFRLMPKQFRLEQVRKTLGPAPCWFTKDQVVGKVGFHLGVTITAASVQGHGVKLQLADSAGATRTLSAEHVIAATGYKPDLRKLAFLSPEILSGIRSVENTPVLSANFESSMASLYFIGITAANTFGPLLRFAFGAGFAAPRLAKHLGRTAIPTLAKGSSAAKSQAERTSQAAEPVVR
jgi:hypothetical protein